MQKIFIIGVALVTLTSCAAPSTTLENEEGKTFRCSSWGFGLIGTAVAISAYSDCMNKIEASGYRELPKASDVPQTILGKDGQLQFVLPPGWVKTEPPVSVAARLDVQIFARNPSIDSVVVITSVDKKDIPDLAQYIKGIEATQIELISNGVGSDIEELTINGNRAARVDVHGTEKGVNVHYLITAIETQGHVIKMNVGTAESKFATNRPAFEAMATGLSEGAKTAPSR